MPAAPHTAPADFTAIHNVQERAVFEAVRRLAQERPDSTPARHPTLLVDVACVALNRLPPRYIRHDADWAFYQTPQEREAQEAQVRQAVADAFDHVLEQLRQGKRGPNA